MFQFSHFLGPFSRFYVRLCAREMVWNGMEPTGISGIRSVLSINHADCSPRTPHGSHIKKWWKGTVPGSHTKMFEGSAPNRWPLKNGKCHDLQKVVSTAFWVGEKPIRTWDELRRGYILLGVAAGCADEPWHAMAQRVQAEHLRLGKSPWNIGSWWKMGT